MKIFGFSFFPKIKILGEYFENLYVNACDGQAGPDLKALAPNLASDYFASLSNSSHREQTLIFWI